jgi:hypothetical protein
MKFELVLVFIRNQKLTRVQDQVRYLRSDRA